MFRDPAHKEQWLSFVCQRGVLGFFAQPVTLRSGRVSHWYVNWRDVAEDVWALDQCVTFLLEFVAGLPEAPDTIFGVAEGASKLALLAQYRYAKQSSHFGPQTHCLAMGRGKLKTHGASKDRYFLGVPRGKTLLIEDVTTTGDSLLGALETLREAEVDVIGALCLTDRCEQRADGQRLSDILGALGIPFWSMSDIRTLLPLVWKQSPPPVELQPAILAEATELFGADASSLLQKGGVLPCE